MTKIYFSYMFRHPLCVTHSSPNLWNFPRVESDKGVLLCEWGDLWKRLRMRLRMGLVARRTNHRIRWLELSFLPRLWGRCEGMEVDSLDRGQWFNQLCLYNEASIKTLQEDGVQRASGSVSTRKFRQEWYTWRGHGSSGPLSRIPRPMHLFHPAVPFTINNKVT